MIFGFQDVRWNSWRWRPLLDKWGSIKMLIDPRILKTATFLVVNDEPSSTVFLIRWLILTDVYAYYAVTTRHSLSNSVVSIRFNLKSGGTEDQAFLAADWIQHPSTDVAVLPLPPDLPLDSYDLSFVSPFDFARNKNHLVEMLASHDDVGPGTLMLPYGTGDEIYSIGLFEGHTGENLAQPLARFGHIALKPAEGEKIFAEINRGDLTPIDAFLVEMATWRGQSGSPVFLHVPLTLEEELTEEFAEPKDYLIGMVQGFYPGIQDVQINGKDATLSPLQMGIGIVIPVRDIEEVLMQKQLEEQRKKLEKDKQQKPKLRPSAASIRKEADMTKESFEDVLKRVSRKTSEPDSA